MKTIFQVIAEVAAFCNTHRGRCFEGWDNEKIYNFICWHVLNKGLIVRHVDGEIAAVGFGNCEPSEAILHREEIGQTHFEWLKRERGDGLLITAVIGNRKDCGDIFKRAKLAFPEAKRFFSIRRRRLVEFSPEVLERFAR